jgi:hypothetical protein
LKSKEIMDFKIEDLVEFCTETGCTFAIVKGRYNVKGKVTLVDREVQINASADHPIYLVQTLSGAYEVIPRDELTKT